LEKKLKEKKVGKCGKRANKRANKRDMMKYLVYGFVLVEYKVT
jgi:hypothetical protein